MADEPTAKLSFAQSSALWRLYFGHRIDYGIRGRSAYGGLEGTIRVLRREGYIDAAHELTDKGRAWLAGDRAEPYNPRRRRRKGVARG